MARLTFAQAKLAILFVVCATRAHSLDIIRGAGEDPRFLYNSCQSYQIGFWHTHTITYFINSTSYTLGKKWIHSTMWRMPKVDKPIYEYWIQRFMRTNRQHSHNYWVESGCDSSWKFSNLSSCKVEFIIWNGHMGMYQFHHKQIAEWINLAIFVWSLFASNVDTPSGLRELRVSCNVRQIDFLFYQHTEAHAHILLLVLLLAMLFTRNCANDSKEGTSVRIYARYTSINLFDTSKY